MHRLMAAAAICALAIGTAAHAQSVDVSPSAQSLTRVGDHANVSHPAGAGDLTDGSRGVHYTSTYSVTPSDISFESGGVAIGDQTLSTSQSRIDMTITNNGPTAISGNMHSQITPAGMGVYLGDNSLGNCLTAPTSCAQTHGLHTLSELGQLSNANHVAGVSFDFQIQQDGQTLYDLTGGLQIYQDGSVILSNETSAAAAVLNGFTTLDQFGNPGSALGFAWNATDITQQLGAIAAGGSSTISYIVTVQSFSTAGCFADKTCLVTYSGFGDPIGRGGDITSANIFSSNSLDFDSGNGGTQFINGVNFSPVKFGLPHFNLNGDLVFTGAGAPEPATWMSLIMGFGLLGAALRRRRVLAYA